MTNVILNVKNALVNPKVNACSAKNRCFCKMGYVFWNARKDFIKISQQNNAKNVTELNVKRKFRVMGILLFSKYLLLLAFFVL